jgi:thiol:disulfide interchange protein DsbA
MKLRIVAGLLLVFAALQGVEAQEFEEGTHYVRLAVPVATADDTRVEMVEVFSYACIHCKTFDPALEAWRAGQGSHVMFRRVPAVFNPTWALFAQAFYTAEALDVADTIHTPMFMGIHDQGIDLREPALMAQLFETFAGVPPEEFEQVFNSFGVKSRVQQATALGRAYHVNGVPTLIVDGLFRTDGQMAGSNALMLEVVDYLVAQQAETRGIEILQAPAAPAGLSVGSD